MRKVVLIGLTTLVCLFIIFGFATWYDGILFEKNYRNLIGIINLDNRAKIDILAYDRHWMHSTAKIRLTPLSTTFTDENHPISLIIENNIVHGPLIFDHGLTFAYASIKSFIHLPGQLESQHGTPGDHGITQLHTLATFGGDWLNQIKINALTIPLEANSQLIWQGLTGYFNFTVVDSLINKIKIKLAIGALTNQGDINQINVQSVSYANQATRQTSGVWNGDSQIVMPSADIKMADGSNIAIDNLTMASQFGVNTDVYYNLNFKMAMGKFTISDKAMTSTFSPVNVSLIINNLNLQGVKDIADFVKSLRSQHQISNVDVQNYIILLPRLITPATTINEEMTIGTNLGEFNSNAKLYWPSNTPMTAATLFDVMQQANAILNIRAAIPLVNEFINVYFDRYVKMTASVSQTPTTETQQLKADMLNQLVNTWLEKGYITKVNNDYVTSITEENGVVKINGNSLAPSA